MPTAGLSADPVEYRSRLGMQAEDQLDAWMIELMRDMSIRRGVRDVIGDFRKATGVDDQMVGRIFAAGGGPPAAVGHSADGELMVPAISLHYLVKGTRALMPDAARERLTRYLVDNFHEIVYI